VLSKNEREYLSGVYHPSKSYKRYLEHKIRKKLNDFYFLELPLLQNSKVKEFTNTVSDFTNTQCDSNLRANETQAKLNLESRKSLGSLHSLDSANACGALGRGIEALRARFHIHSNSFQFIPQVEHLALTV